VYYVDLTPLKRSQRPLTDCSVATPPQRDRSSGSCIPTVLNSRMSTTQTSLKRKLKETTASVPVRVAYKGMAHDFTYNAAGHFFQQCSSDIVDHQGKTSLKEVFASVQSGSADYGIVPVESSSFGSINGVLEAILGSDGGLVIVGEQGVIEHLPLCVRGPGKDVDIDEVVSHPHILERCGDYLDHLDHKRAALGKPVITRTATWDTSAAAEVAFKNLDTAKVMAAICSREAASHYGLRIVEDTVSSFKNAEVTILAAFPLFCTVLIN
jgi:chorismate mutase / prephenate dehydratase